MNKTFLSLALILCLAFVLAKNLKRPEHEDEFQDFTKKHSKRYRSEEEKQYRFSVFKKNIDHIDKLNKQHHAVFKTNKFSDLSQEEFLNIYAGAVPEPDPISESSQLPSDQQNNPSSEPLPFPEDIAYPDSGYIQKATPPASLDLRTSPGVTSIKDQGSCGSCWAFSTNAALEYANWKKTGASIDLSEQQLVDCVYTQNGCNGGWMTTAMNYIAKNGVSLEKDYPYTSVYGTCKSSQVSKPVLLRSSSPYIQIASDDTSIKTALQNYGVLSACVDASSWASYSSGIFQDVRMQTQAPTGNHAVNIVGYGTDSKTNTSFFLIRNSWGPQWGESGYIRLDARRYSNGYSYSGILFDSITYPVLK